MAQIISFVPLVMIGLTALTGIRVYFINAPTPLRILSQLWLLTFAIEALGYIVRESTDMQNQWMYNLFHFFFIFFLANIFFYVLENERIKLSIQIFYGVFIVFVLLNSLFIQGLTNVQSLTYVVGGVFIIYLSGAYFWQLFVSAGNEKITYDPFFWLSFGLIVYFGGTVPFFGMLNYLQDNFYEFTEFYLLYISNAFAIFLNILVFIAFICRKSYPK
jgi:hypothetical protein